MEKTAMSKPILIMTSDWHLREDTPVARTDDYAEAQWHALKRINQLSYQYDIPVLHAGDLVHKWRPIKPSLYPGFFGRVNQMLPKQFFVVPGQHDLPEHRLELLNESALQLLMPYRGSILWQAGVWTEIVKGVRVRAYPYGTTPEPADRTDGFKICAAHFLTWHKDKPFPGCKDDNAMTVLKRLKGYDLILVGDNHQTFQVEYRARTLLSPGSLMRMTAKQMEHKPAVFLLYRNGTIKRMPLPVRKNALTREHLEEKEVRQKRFGAYVDRVGKGMAHELDYCERLRQWMKGNMTRQEVRKALNTAMEEC